MQPGTVPVGTADFRGRASARAAAPRAHNCAAATAGGVAGAAAQRQQGLEAQSATQQRCLRGRSAHIVRVTVEEDKDDVESMYLTECNVVDKYNHCTCTRVHVPGQLKP